MGVHNTTLTRHTNTKLAAVATAERAFAFTPHLSLSLLRCMLDAWRNGLASGLPALCLRCLRARRGRSLCPSLHDHLDMTSSMRLRLRLKLRLRLRLRLLLQLQLRLRLRGLVLCLKRLQSPLLSLLGFHFGLSGLSSTISTHLLPFLVITNLSLLHRDLRILLFADELPFQCRDLVQHRVALSVEIFLEIVDDHVLLTHTLYNGTQQARAGLQLFEQMAVIVLHMRVSVVFTRLKDSHT